MKVLFFWKVLPLWRFFFSERYYRNERFYRDRHGSLLWVKPYIVLVGTFLYRSIRWAYSVFYDNGLLMNHGDHWWATVFHDEAEEKKKLLSWDLKDCVHIWQKSAISLLPELLAWQLPLWRREVRTLGLLAESLSARRINAVASSDFGLPLFASWCSPAPNMCLSYFRSLSIPLLISTDQYYWGSPTL